MRRIRDNGENEDLENVRQAFYNYSENKHKRRTVKDFEDELEANLHSIVADLKNESWIPSPYTPKVIFEKKRRQLAKAPVYDHVLEAAAILPYEQTLYDYIAWQSPAVRPNLGTHQLMKNIRNDFFNNSQEEMGFYVDMDVHHYFPTMDHAILKEHIGRKVKPGKLRNLLFKVVDSYLQGAPLGIKVSQIFGQLNLSDFDRLLLRFFDIGKDPEKMAYWTQRYITAKILTCSTPEDEKQLSKGVAFLSERFRQFVSEGVKHYHRFVDNIIIIHQDKAVLHILKELCIMVLARDYLLEMNGNYNVRPTWTGIRIVGYVFYPEKTLLGKSNKKELCRRVAHLRKKGLSEEEIRINQASRFGYAKHVNSIHLLKSLGMEKSLGKIIKKRRLKAPFEGMSPEQKVKFSSICRSKNEETGAGWNKKILLIDYTVEDSKIDKTRVTMSTTDDSGEMRQMEQVVAGKVLAIRFKKIVQVFEFINEHGEQAEGYTFEKMKDKNGNPTDKDAEFYSFSGSKILIDQAMNDFSKSDLPCPTVIQQFEGKQGQSFFKFT